MEHTWLSTFPGDDGMPIPYRVNVLANVRTDVDEATSSTHILGDAGLVNDSE